MVMQILVFITDNTHNLELIETRTLKYLPAHWYMHLFLFLCDIVQIILFKSSKFSCVRVNHLMSLESTH